jgi:hypothetical protein
LIVLMLGAEWLQRGKAHPLQINNIRWAPARAMICCGVIVLILFCCATVNNDFIYFKF